MLSTCLQLVHVLVLFAKLSLVPHQFDWHVLGKLDRVALAPAEPVDLLFAPQHVPVAADQAFAGLVLRVQAHWFDLVVFVLAFD